jgi:hypothetical protein
VSYKVGVIGKLIVFVGLFDDGIEGSVHVSLEDSKVHRFNGDETLLD